MIKAPRDPVYFYSVLDKRTLDLCLDGHWGKVDSRQDPHTSTLGTYEKPRDWSGRLEALIILRYRDEMQRLDNPSTSLVANLDRDPLVSGRSQIPDSDQLGVSSYLFSIRRFSRSFTDQTQSETLHSTLQFAKRFAPPLVCTSHMSDIIPFQHYLRSGMPVALYTTLRIV